MKRNIIASLLLVFTILFLLNSCTKIDTTDLGADLIPAVDNINTFETILDVVTDNKLYNDTTRMLYHEAHALGIINNDAEFGKTTATVYSSFSPAAFRSYPFLNRDSVTIDSLILSMDYLQSYGDSNSVQKVEVSEIDPTASFSDSLYLLSQPDFAIKPAILGSKTINFFNLRNDSVIYRNGKDVIRSKNEMRIQLDTAFARRFVNYDTTDAFKSDSAFRTKFKGLQIRVNEGASPIAKGLAYFNLDNNSKTRLTFYCRVVVNGKTDTIAPVFTYNNGPHANIIRRTPANGYLANTGNSTLNDDKLYIQSTPGSYASVTIPGLDTMQNSIIHRAELIADKYPSSEDFYAPPTYLFPEAVNATGDSIFTIRNDFVRTTTAAAYDPVSLGGFFRNDQYVLLLTRYVQSIVTKKYPNYTLRISAPYNAQPYYILPNSNSVAGRVPVIVNIPVGSGRVVLYGGGAAGPKRMRLRIIYSKV